MESPGLEKDKFRSSLEDVVAIATRLAPYCESVNDLIELVKPALDSDASLRLLLAEMSKR